MRLNHSVWHRITVTDNYLLEHPGYIHAQTLLYFLAPVEMKQLYQNTLTFNVHMGWGSGVIQVHMCWHGQ